jgi:hypothetical protein
VLAFNEDILLKSKEDLMTNDHPYGNGHVLPEEQPASSRKTWSKLGVLTTVVNGVLFVIFVSVPMLMTSLFGGEEKKSGEVSIEESNWFTLLSLGTSVVIVSLSVAALIINILFFKSLPSVPVGPQVPVAVAKEARTKRFAAALLIAFPGITLIGFIFILFSSLLLLFPAGV